MNRKELLAQAKSLGYSGPADPVKIKAWLTDNGYDLNFLVDGKSIPFDEIWAKTVTVAITRSAGEDVVVENGGTGVEGSDGGGGGPRATPAGSPGDGGGDDGQTSYGNADDQKHVIVTRSSLRALQEAARLSKAAGKVIHAPAVRSGREHARKAYNARFQHEGRSADPNHRIGTAFVDAEKAELFGAWFRLKMARLYASELGDYAAKAEDTEIVKALGTLSNTLGGATVADEFRADLIELKERTSVMRMLIGVTPMAGDTAILPRLVSDVAANWVTENSAETDQNKPTFDNVSLSAKRLRALVRVSTELMQDAALNVGDIVARSMARSMGYAEDDAAINGDATVTYGGIRGLINALDSNAYSTAAATTWALLTLPEILNSFAKLSDIPGLGEPVALCSKQFFHGVIRPLVHAAGGQTMQERIGGFTALIFDGYTFVTCPRAPQALVSAHKIAMWCGFFGAGAKFGESEVGALSTSDQRYFEYDQIGIKMTERIDINIHEKGASGNPIVIAGLKTT